MNSLTPALPAALSLFKPEAADDATARLLVHGAPPLSDVELLAVLLTGRNRTERAQRLLESFGSLRMLAREDAAVLEHRRELGKSGAAALLAAVELGRRLREVPDSRPRITTPKEVYRYLAPRLELLRREVFHVLCFDSRNRLLQDARVAEGSQGQCLVDPRDVFAVALGVRATGIILAHCHPAGDPKPSEPDKALTQRLVEGADLLGITVLDHIIIGHLTFHSMREASELPKQASVHFGGGR